MTTLIQVSSAQQPEVEHNNQNEERSTQTSSQTMNEADDDIDENEFIVPILPIPLAIVCCLFNFVIPGLGTMLAACCSPCCADSEEMTARRRYASCCVVFGIGILQLIMTACFLVGWIWSAIWGLSLVGTAVDFSAKENVTSSWREPFRSRRRPRSNFIYPMRAPSDVDRDSPPPPYMMFPTPPPEYVSPSESRTQSPDLVDNPEFDAETSREQVNKTSLACVLCEKSFSPSDRRYLCRHCTGIVCANCFTKTFVVNGKRKYIICDKCHEKTTPREPENG